MTTLATSKSRKVESYVRDQITKGIWSPGTRIPEKEQLATELGVSYQTVKMVMTQLASDGLVQRIQRKGTFVASKPKTANIVILGNAEIIKSNRSNHYRIFLERSSGAIEKFGYQPVLRLGMGDTEEKVLASLQFPEGLIGKDTVGILTITGLDTVLKKTGIPFVGVLAAPFEGCENAIILDYATMYRLGKQTLRDQGYNDFVLMYTQLPVGHDYSAMFEEMGRERLEAVDGQAERLIGAPYSPDCRFAYDTFKKLWQLGRRPRAIFFDDEVGFDVASRAVLELGIKVPEELAILTQGIVGVYYHFPLPVSCVEFDAGQVADLAWEKLQNLILGQAMPEPVFVKPRLREGKTL